MRENKGKRERRKGKGKEGRKEKREKYQYIKLDKLSFDLCTIKKYNFMKSHINKFYSLKKCTDFMSPVVVF